MFEPLLNLFAEESGSKLTKIIIKIIEIGCYIVISAFIYKYFFGNFDLIDFNIRILITDFLINGKFVVPLIIYIVVSNCIKLPTFFLINYIVKYLYLNTEIPFKALASTIEENFEFINSSPDKFLEYHKISMSNEQLDGSIVFLELLGIVYKKKGELYYNKYNSLEETLKKTNTTINLNLKYLRISIALWVVYIFQDYSLFTSHPFLTILISILFLILILLFIIGSSYEEFIDTHKSYLLDTIDGCRILFNKKLL